jgi:hypothetical protein
VHACTVVTYESCHLWHRDQKMGPIDVQTSDPAQVNVLCGHRFLRMRLSTKAMSSWHSAVEMMRNHGHIERLIK